MNWIVKVFSDNQKDEIEQKKRKCEMFIIDNTDTKWKQYITPGIQE